MRIILLTVFNRKIKINHSRPKRVKNLTEMLTIEKKHVTERWGTTNNEFNCVIGNAIKYNDKLKAVVIFRQYRPRQKRLRIREYYEDVILTACLSFNLKGFVLNSNQTNHKSSSGHS